MVDEEGPLFKTFCMSRFELLGNSVAENLNLPGCDMSFFILRVKPFKSLDCLTLNLKALGQEILNQGHSVTSLKH
jgi:hypothetical protein